MPKKRKKTKNKKKLPKKKRSLKKKKNKVKKTSKTRRKNYKRKISKIKQDNSGPKELIFPSQAKGESDADPMGKRRFHLRYGDPRSLETEIYCFNGRNTFSNQVSLF